jgi:N-dimethylarginine dimethylaminohydrolase
MKHSIEVDDDEARTKLAANACCPDGRHVLIQSGCTKTNRALESAGYRAVEVETSEFLKSGGSVFCLKLAIGARSVRRE